MCFIGLLLIGSFLYEHITTVRFAIPAAMLHLFLIGVFGTLIQLMVATQSIDYSKPIGVIQNDLERLKMRRIRYTQWVLLLAPLLWTPLMIVMMKGLLGIDAYHGLGTTYLLANLLFGIAFIPLAIWLSKKYSKRMGHSPFFQRLMDDIAGDSLKRASAILVQLSEFEEE